MNRVDKTESYLSTLPPQHQNMMIKYRDHLHRIRNCIDENFQIIRKLIEDVGNLFENANQSVVPKSNSRVEDDDIRIRIQDMDKVRNDSQHMLFFLLIFLTRIGTNHIG